MIRVLISLDDHAIVRKGIRALLSESGGFEIVAEAADGQEAVRSAEETQPDVILMDLLMPGMDGIEATRQITGRQPGARILVLTSFAADNKVFPAIKAGRWDTYSRTPRRRSSSGPSARCIAVSRRYIRPSRAEASARGCTPGPRAASPGGADGA